MPKSLTQTLDDPEFRKLKPDTQKAVLKKLGVSDDMQGKLLAKIATPASTGTGTPAASQPSWLSRVNTRVGGQLESMNKTISTGLKDLFEGKAFSSDEPGAQAKEVREMASGPVGALTVGPRIVGKQVAGMVKDWASDSANLAGDVLMGEMLGGGETKLPKPAEVIKRTPEQAIRAHVESGVPEHLRRLTDEQRSNYTAALDKANQEHTQALIDHAEKESQARAKWVQKAYGAKKSVADSIAAANKRSVLERGAREHVRLAQDNIKDTHAAVRGSLDERWGKLRSEMGSADVSSPEDIYNGIKGAEEEFLRGAPQSVQQFRNLIKELGIKDFVENEDGTLDATEAMEDAKPLDWETARVHYSAIGDRLASGNLPGNVYQALKSVHNLLDEKLHATAEYMGHGTEYDGLKRDWSEYMRDWRDTSAVSTGGSPIAKILQSPDQGYVQMQITGKAGDRMLSTLGKYRRFGARPELAAQARTLINEAKNVGRVKVKEAPAPYQASKPPGLKEVKPPKPDKPKGKPVSPVTRAGIRVGGHLSGLAAGGALGHPFLGWGAGGTLAEAGIRALEKKRAAEAAELAGQ